jgi:hypothetical protein
MVFPFLFLKSLYYQSYYISLQTKTTKMEAFPVTMLPTMPEIQLPPVKRSKHWKARFLRAMARIKKAKSKK